MFVFEDGHLYIFYQVLLNPVLLIGRFNFNFTFGFSNLDSINRMFIFCLFRPKRFGLIKMVVFTLTEIHTVRVLGLNCGECFEIQNVAAQTYVNDHLQRL